MKRSTLIALGIFVVLLGAAFMMSRKPAQRGRQELDLSSLNPDMISGLSITAKGGEEDVKLKKTDGVWKLSDGHLADPEAVSRALKAIGEIKTSDLISHSASRREKYGVSEEKALKLGLDTDGNESIALLLGTSEKGGTYLRRDGENAIFKLKKNISYLFPAQTKRWLKLKLVDGEIGDLKGASIELSGEKAYELIPGDEDTEWKLNDTSLLPQGFRFDGKAARSLVQQAVSCRATEIVDEVPEGVDTGLGEGEDRISLQMKDGPVSIHLGSSADKNLVWARVDGRDRFFKIPEYQAKNLRKKLEDLRDLHLMHFDPEKLSDLRLEAGKTEIHLHRDDGGIWAIDEKVSKPPKDFHFDPAMVDAFIRSLAGLRAEKYLGTKITGKPGFDHPSIRIELEASGAPPIQLLIGRKISGKGNGEGFYAQGNVDDAFYLIPAFQKERFSRAWELFRKINRPPGGGMGNIDPETLAKLPPEIRKQLLQQMQQQKLHQQFQNR